jgi:hypothetical protein
MGSGGRRVGRTESVAPPGSISRGEGEGHSGVVMAKQVTAIRSSAK